MKNNAKYDSLFTEEQKETMRKDYLENLLSIENIGQKYNIKSRSWISKKLLNGIIRSKSERNKIAHQRYPEKFKHSDETKQLMSEKRLKFMKEHPEETAWRKRNEPSYPEKCFIKFLDERGYSSKYFIEREKSIFPFYIDFAFINEKVAVEIDGGQHLNEDRKLRDEQKDELLKPNGRKVIRISENTVKTDWNIIDNILTKELSSISRDKITTKVGILKHQTKSNKVERDANGYSEKQKESFIANRKVKDRPDKETLYNKLKELKNFSALSKLYGVSDKAIVKWCKSYGLTYHIKDYKI